LTRGAAAKVMKCEARALSAFMAFHAFLFFTSAHCSRLKAFVTEITLPSAAAHIKHWQYINKMETVDLFPSSPNISQSMDQTIISICILVSTTFCAQLSATSCSSWYCFLVTLIALGGTKRRTLAK
jgi:hypothetical protein